MRKGSFWLFLAVVHPYDKVLIYCYFILSHVRANSLYYGCLHFEFLTKNKGLGWISHLLTENCL